MMMQRGACLRGRRQQTRDGTLKRLMIDKNRNYLVAGGAENDERMSASSSCGGCGVWVVRAAASTTSSTRLMADETWSSLGWSTLVWTVYTLCLHPVTEMPRPGG